MKIQSFCPRKSFQGGEGAWKKGGEGQKGGEKGKRGRGEGAKRRHNLPFRATPLLLQVQEHLLSSLLGPHTELPTQGQFQRASGRGEAGNDAGSVDAGDSLRLRAVEKHALKVSPRHHVWLTLTASSKNLPPWVLICSYM